MTSEPPVDDLVAGARALAFAARALERSLDDMTLPQFRVLALVASSPDRANRLAEKAAVSRPSLTALLDGLEARGWIRRRHVEGDRRGVALEVTAAGADAIVDAERSMATALDDLLGAVSSAEQAKALRGLGALQRAVRTNHERKTGLTRA